MDKKDKRIIKAAQAVLGITLPDGSILLEKIVEFDQIDPKGRFKYQSAKDVCDLFHTLEKSGVKIPDEIWYFVVDDEIILNDWFLIALAAYDILHKKKEAVIGGKTQEVGH